MLDPEHLGQELVGFVRTFAGGDQAKVTTLKGQLSTRRYHRVATHGQPESCVVMELPDDARSEPASELPFLNLHAYLSRRRYPVPRVYRAEVARGLIALEDLGDCTLEEAVRRSRTARQRRALYLKAIALIARLQRLGATRPDAACLAFGRRFDFKLLRWELDHFREWLLEADRQVILADAERATLESQFDWLARTLADAPPVLVHRDFQSRNIMVVSGHGGRRSLRVIDFQDALLGPRVYDLVALLRDSYLELDANLVDQCLSEYAQTSGDISVIQLTYLFHLQTVQRKLKDAGRFVYIERVRGLSEFRAAIPLTLSYVRSALDALPALAPLRALLARHLPELR